VQIGIFSAFCDEFTKVVRGRDCRKPLSSRQARAKNQLR
jgi:hypothetical protein